METERVKKLFENLYGGNPWLDITLRGTLSAIPAEKAAIKPLSGGNSIWEITNHMISWRETVLQRIQGEAIATPADNYIRPVTDLSEQAWQETLIKLDESQKQWAVFLTNFRDGALGDISPENGHTHYEHIHGIIQHDAYHLGQIVLIAKYHV